MGLPECGAEQGRTRLQLVNVPEACRRVEGEDKGDIQHGERSETVCVVQRERVS